MSPTGLGLVALLTGIAALITAIGGVLLAIRAVRSNERKAAQEELEQVSQLLTRERHERIAAETRNHELELLLVQEGIALPPREPVTPYEPYGHGSEGAADADNRVRGGGTSPRHVDRLRHRRRKREDDEP